MWFALYATAAFATPERCLTLTLLPDAPRIAHSAQIPPPDGEKIGRDAYGAAQVRSSDNFAVRWGAEANLDERAIDDLLAAFEAAWSVEVERMGHPAPEGADAWLFNVYVGSTGDNVPRSYGSSGYYTLDDEGWPMIVVDPFILDDPLWAEITAAHEFYHALQDRLGTFDYSGESAWYWEATADWAASEVHPDNGYFAEFLFGFAFVPHLPLSYFDYPDRGAVEEYHQYGAFIFPKYLTEKVADWTVVRDSWLLGGDDDPLVVIDGLLASWGTSIDAVFPAFTAHNATWDYIHEDVYEAVLDLYAGWYKDEDHRLTATVSVDGTDGPTEVSPELLPRRYGYNIIAMARPHAGMLRVAFQGDAEGTRGTDPRFAAHVVVESEDGADYAQMALDGGSGELGVELAGTERNVFLVVSTRAESAGQSETFGYAYEMAWEAQDTGLIAEEEPVVAGVAGTAWTRESDTRGCGCASAPRPLPALAGLAAVLAGLVGLRRRRA